MKRKRRHIHSKLLVLTSMNGVFFLSKWFVLLYRLTKSFPFSMNYLDFIKGELSYFLFVNLDGGWCLGVGMCFFCKWKTCNVAKLINIRCMRKKKVHWIWVCPLKSGNGRHLVFYYTDKEIHIHLSQFVII